MNNEKKEFPLTKTNYKLLLIGIGIIVLGYILMSGGGTDNPNQFNPEIFSFRRITLAPLVCLAGYGFVLYAILKKTGE